MESLCDICCDPGACCRDVCLSHPVTGKNFGRVPTATHANVLMATNWLPFVASRHVDTADGDGYYRFTCTMLDARGRCSDYEHRPELCRIYQPAQDGLCAMRPWVR